MKNKILKFSFTAPGKIRNLQQKRLQNGNVELTWDAPFAKGNDVITYLVMYGGSTKKTKEKRYVIESDTQDRTYDVKVSKENGEKNMVSNSVTYQFIHWYIIPGLYKL